MGLANATASLRTASVRQDQRKYCVLVLRTHPVGSVVSNVQGRFVHLPVFVLAPLHEAVDDDAQAPISHGYRCQGPTCFSSHFQRQSKGSYLVLVWGGHVMKASWASS